MNFQGVVVPTKKKKKLPVDHNSNLDIPDDKRVKEPLIINVVTTLLQQPVEAGKNGVGNEYVTRTNERAGERRCASYLAK